MFFPQEAIAGGHGGTTIAPATSDTREGRRRNANIRPGRTRCPLAAQGERLLSGPFHVYRFTEASTVSTFPERCPAEIREYE